MKRAWGLCVALLTVLLAACTDLARDPPGDPPGDPPDRGAVLTGVFAASMPKLLAANHVPSVSIAHIEHDKLVFVGAFGNQSRHVPATDATLYNLASLTKPVSAQVVLRLASVHALQLDEPMHDYWVDPDIANDPRNKLLTPRLALSHQTGFPNWRRMSGGVLAFERAPGTAYGYSGEGYEYLRRYVEKKFQSPFEDMAEEEVLQPLGMSDTAYTGRPWFNGRIAVPTDAKGHALKPEISNEANAADLLYSTAHDYAKFMLAVLDDTGMSRVVAADRIRIQVPETIALCAHGRVEGCADEEGFGLGWEVARFGDSVYLMHDGHDTGVATFVYLSLKEHNGTVILTNSDNGRKLVLPILDLFGVDAPLVTCLRNETC